MALPSSEGVDPVDADEHAMPGAVVLEAGAIGGGGDGPALRVVGLVVDGDGRDRAEIAEDPLHGAGGGDVHAVGMLAVFDRGIGERRLAADAVFVDLAAGLAGFGFDEDVTVLVGRQRNGTGRRSRARRCRR